MKKKLILSLLLITLLASMASCNKSDTEKHTVSKDTTETTLEPTNSPLPTAEVSITENSDGTSQLNNTTAGYNISYDSKLLEMSNTDSSISFAPSNEKAKEELDLFLTITETDATSAKELEKQLRKSYKGYIEQKEVTLGTDNTSANFYTITDNKKTTHEIYIISSDEKGWYIELKCPSKYEKKYLTAFEDILSSMDFSATIAE